MNEKNSFSLEFLQLRRSNKFNFRKREEILMNFGIGFDVEFSFWLFKYYRIKDDEQSWERRENVGMENRFSLEISKLNFVTTDTIWLKYFSATEISSKLPHEELLSLNLSSITILKISKLLWGWHERWILMWKLESNKNVPLNILVDFLKRLDFSGFFVINFC